MNIIQLIIVIAIFVCSLDLMRGVKKMGERRKLRDLADKVFEDLCNPQISGCRFGLEGHLIVFYKEKLNEHSLKTRAVTEHEVFSYVLRIWYTDDLSQINDDQCNVVVSIAEKGVTLYERNARIEIPKS